MSGYRQPRISDGNAQSNGHFGSPRQAYLFLIDELLSTELRDRMHRNGYRKEIRDLIVQGDIVGAHDAFKSSGMPLEEVKQTVIGATVELIISGHLKDAKSAIGMFVIDVLDLKHDVTEKLEKPMFQNNFELVERIRAMVLISDDECVQPALNAMRKALIEGYPAIARRIKEGFGVSDAQASRVAANEITRRMRSEQRHAMELIGDIAVAFGLTRSRLQEIAIEIDGALSPGADVQQLLRQA